MDHRVSVLEGRPAKSIEAARDAEPASHECPDPSVTSDVMERLSRFTDVRIVRPGLPNRIGHLILDFESYIKERLLAGKTRKPIYIVDERVPCNRCILDYWRKYIRVVEGPLAERLRAFTEYSPLVDNLEHRYAYTLEGASSCFAIEARWGERPPLFELDRDHGRRGEGILKKMGLPQDAWFVCVHARGSGYSPGDEFYHSYRNVSVSSYIPAMEEIVRRGGWCIRVGDPTMDPLTEMPQTIDYALSPFKNDWMDVFLGARCRFFLGSCSGLFLISSAFGVASALTNMAPIGCTYSVFRKDISIPKLFLGQDGTPVPFPSLLASPVADLRFAEHLAKAGVTLAANSPDEIRDLTCEMLDRLDGAYVSTTDNERRQQDFRNLFHERNYSWGSCARIGDAFLARHEALLYERGEGKHQRI